MKETGYGVVELRSMMINDFQLYVDDDHDRQHTYDVDRTWVYILLLLDVSVVVENQVGVVMLNPMLTTWI